MDCPFCAERIQDAAKRCPHCHSDVDRNKGVRRFFRQAWKRSWLVGTLVLNALFSAWIVPLIVERLNHEQTIYDARLKLANRIVAEGTEIEETLNDVETILQIFQQDSMKMPLAAIKADQESMRQRLVDRYLAFQHKGWWWYTAVQRDSEYPEPLSKQDKKRLDDLCDDYRAALLEEAAALTVLWDAVMRTPPSAHAPATDPYKNVFDQQAPSLLHSGNARREAFHGMAWIFDHAKRPHHWWLP